MKKILLIILLFVSVKAFAQYPVPSGVTNFISTKIFYKISGSDTTVYMQSANGYWFPVGRKNNLVAKASDFEGAGTTSDKFGIRDTLLKSNWIIKSTSTSLPGLTIDAENSDLTTPTIAVFKFNGSRVSAIGSAGGYFGRGVFANSGGDYASVFTDTTGTLISRKKADSNPVLRLINLSSGSTGDFLFAGDSTSTKFRITRQGGIIAPLLPDTTGLTKNIVWNSSTGKFYTQTGGGGAFLPLSFAGANTVQQNGHDLIFNDVNAGSDSTFFQQGSNFGAWQSTNLSTHNYGTINLGEHIVVLGLGPNISSSQGSDIKIQNSSGVYSAQMRVIGSGSKVTQLNIGSQPYILQTDQINHRTIKADSISIDFQKSSVSGYNYLVKRQADSLYAPISGGGGTVTSITPGVGFLSHTPITTSGTMNVDTASTIVTKTFAGRYVTNSSTTTFTNKTGNISQWTNDSGYITSASVPVAANPTASVGGSPVNGTATTFMRSDAAPKADTSVLQTVLNIFPKGDTRYLQKAATTLPSSFVNSSLTSVGTLGGLTVTAAPTFSAMTSGSVLFAGTSGLLSQNNANLFWDNTNKFLGVGTNSPADFLHVNAGTTSGGVTVEETNSGTHSPWVSVKKGTNQVFWSLAGATDSFFIGTAAGDMIFRATTGKNIWFGASDGSTGASLEIVSGGDIKAVSGNLVIGTAGKELKVAEGTNGFAGQTTLVAGTKAITISGVTTSSRAFVQLVSQGGTVTTTQVYAAVCTANTLTITALTNAGSTDTTDTSVLNYFIIN